MSDYRAKFSGIYDEHLNKIYRFVYLKVDSQEIAEDITSEVFLRTYEFLRDGKKLDNNQAFLYRVARNLVIDHYRDKGKISIISAENVPILDHKENIEERAMINSDIVQAKLAIAKLNDDYQNMIIWHYLEELSVKEISKMIDKSEEATRVQLHRALKALRNQVNLI